MTVLISNPSLIKLPIIDEKKLVIGFNEREIRCFLSKQYRSTRLLHNNCYRLVEENIRVQNTWKILICLVFLKNNPEKSK
ncbi:hypothetical protein IAE44_08155 [Enterococcus sp. S52]|nr:hypothetical protein [Enterococcus sp. S52]MBK0070384.1 hypothetical protein [Enterococcus sp. S53]MBK0141224.1 hypothetical protein [Enterococcus sp. S76]MBK0144612.1 hypothetical protein [Enterococcus sp. S77]